jgi:hypothetical protein
MLARLFETFARVFRLCAAVPRQAGISFYEAQQHFDDPTLRMDNSTEEILPEACRVEFQIVFKSTTHLQTFFPYIRTLKHKVNLSINPPREMRIPIRIELNCADHVCAG